MIIFFDTEFTGLYRDAQLISIGIVAQNGQKFYGEFTDYASKSGRPIDKRVKDNVIKHTTAFDENFKSQVESDNNCVFIRANEHYIKHALSDWLEHFGESIQLISDVCHYDMFLFCDLFGGAFNIPECVNPVCYDICQDIARMITVSEKEVTAEPGGPIYHTNELSLQTLFPICNEQTVHFSKTKEIKRRYYLKEVITSSNGHTAEIMKFAFDVNREALCVGLCGSLPAGNKHNSLFDAEVIKMIYEATNYLREENLE